MITWTERAKAAISKNNHSDTGKTDETAVARLVAVSAGPTVAVPAMTEPLSSVLTGPFLIALEKHESSIGVTENPDRWCWPHSSAMNGVEIETFAVRLHQFNDKGLAHKDGETLADKLVLRDRDQDDRRVCLECKHFAGHNARAWRCSNWQAAGIAIHSRDAELTANLVVQLQRCDGFSAHPIFTL